MVSISVETPQETEVRLLSVFRQATVNFLPGLWAFEEFPLEAFPQAVSPSAVALVRDEQVWSQLVPCERVEAERFGVFCVHFPANCDNSGFVGWLATRLKQQFGTGVFVTCGQNSGAGGIFDYWGCPAQLIEPVFREITKLAGTVEPTGVDS